VAGPWKKFLDRPQETGAPVPFCRQLPAAAPQLLHLGLPSQKGTSMHLSRFSRRRRQLGAVIAGLCVAAGSVGSIALADSGSSTSVSVEASVFVQAGMNRSAPARPPPT